MGLDTTIWDLLKIKLKRRDDSIFDQYNRLFMVRLLLIGAAIGGISWSTDHFHCTVPRYIPDSTELEEYAHTVETSCWIQGLFIHRSLATLREGTAYYGITEDIDFDGLITISNESKKLCKTKNRMGKKPNEACKRMEKTFFTQYQYLPFLLSALALFYYLPYLLHKVAAYDIIKLREATKHDQTTDSKKMSAENIRKYFFRLKQKIFPKLMLNREAQIYANVNLIAKISGPKRYAHFKQNMIHYVLAIAVKLLYIGVNVMTLFFLDWILGYNFADYGIKVFKWTQLNHTEQYDYLGPRENPKPTNVLLPPFGYCEIITTSKDIKSSETDKMRFVCEMSQHILYQYIFIVLWVLIMLGILVAFVSFGISCFKLIFKITGLRAMQENDSKNKRIIKQLTYREIEYLDYLDHHDKTLYGGVLEILTLEQEESVRASDKI